jgi:predicted lipase
MSENDDVDWDEIESEHREQTERTDRAHETGETFADVVAEQYRRFEEGDLNATVSAYDKHTAALLAALDESGELDRVVDTLQDELGQNTSGDATKSQLLVAATRYAVGNIDEDLLEEAREGYQEMQDTPF